MQRFVSPLCDFSQTPSEHAHASSSSKPRECPPSAHVHGVRIVLLVAIFGFLLVFFTNEDFFRWSFKRHHNTLSWVRTLSLAVALIRRIFSVRMLYTRVFSIKHEKAAFQTVIKTRAVYKEIPTTQ